MGGDQRVVLRLGCSDSGGVFAVAVGMYVVGEDILPLRELGEAVEEVGYKQKKRIVRILFM